MNLAKQGECSGKCSRCNEPFQPGQAVMVTAIGVWLGRKIGKLMDTQLMHTVCPTASE